MANPNKRRKIDCENRTFHESWTEDYLFILPARTDARPTCLICHSTVALIKSGNIKRHYESKHADFESKYPPRSSLRCDKVKSLKAGLENSMGMMKKTTTVQQKASEASLRVMWTLGRRKKPFADAEVVKECMLEAASTLFDDKKLLTRLQESLFLTAPPVVALKTLQKTCTSSYFKISKGHTFLHWHVMSLLMALILHSYVFTFGFSMGNISLKIC